MTQQPRRPALAFRRRRPAPAPTPGRRSVATARALAVLVLGMACVAIPAAAEAVPPGEPRPVGVWPLRPVPEVVAGFDPPAQPWQAGHRGVDLLGSPGQPVRTALPGRVAFVGRIAGRGVVVVTHGETRTTYEPVAASVPVGATVAAGDRIGRLETPGSHCFPRACLHWGWLRGTTYLNPLELVGVRPVRLLPLFAPSAARDLAGSPRPFADWRPLLALLDGRVLTQPGRTGAPR